MDKIEFLELLRRTLTGEVKPEVIEQNIAFYDEYISSAAQEEYNQRLQELGDPRLIARTIIEKEKAIQQKGKYTAYAENYSSSYQENDFEAGPNKADLLWNRNSLKWYHKLLFVLMIIVVFVVLIFLGKILFGLLFAFGIPFILIMLFFSVFRNNRK